MLTRRTFIGSLAGGFLAAPLRAGAQQSGKAYRIGALTAAFAPDHPALEGLKAGLRAAGLDEKRDVVFDVRFTEGDMEALPGAAAALVNGNVDLIFAVGQEAADAARAATRRIPVVFAGVGDPVAAGIVSEVARPGGNITGVSSLNTELAGKRLELLKALAPNLRRVWAIYYAGDSSARAAGRKAQEAAAALNLEVLTRPVLDAEERDRALRGLRRGDGLLAPGSPLLDIDDQMLQKSLSARAPVVFPAAFWVRFGVLASYGPDYHAMGSQAARLVARILQGARPGDLPVEGANKIEMAINLKTAKALGLTVPQSLLLRADEVIQ